MSSTSKSSRPTVLVALDGSPAARTALPVARTIASQLDAAVEVLHVASGPAAAEDVRRRLHLDEREAAGLEVRLRVGDPAGEILATAADPNVELVVLTTHGRAIEPGRPLGRVAEAVIASVTRPILLVRPEAAGGAEPAPALQRLLVPLDGTPTTAMALRPGTELAGRLHARVDLLYVAAPGQTGPREPGSITVPRYIDQPQHEWPHWASEVIARLASYCAACPPDVPIQMFVAQGDVGPAVARFAAEHDDHAIVLVRRSHLEMGRAAHLRAILDLTPCPILLVGGSPD